MKSNYYLSHNTNMYLDWLDEYEDVELLKYWIEKEIYCCFGERNFYNTGSGCTLGSTPLSRHGDGRIDSYDCVNGGGLDYYYINVDDSYYDMFLDGRGCSLYWET